jgi:hypothetical protein
MARRRTHRGQFNASHKPNFATASVQRHAAPLFERTRNRFRMVSDIN